MRKLAHGSRSLLTDNHVVPLWKEVQFDDLVFTVVPYVGHSMRECYGEWAKDSVGDIINMILQALEVSGMLRYVNNISQTLTGDRFRSRPWHRPQGKWLTLMACSISHIITRQKDLCKHNYLVQWHPESLSTMQVPLTRPRVFLTDFEMAFEFPSDISPGQRLLTGLPAEGYRRPVAPEVASGLPYDPFKSDIWQFAESLSDFKACRLLGYRWLLT